MLVSRQKMHVGAPLTTTDIKDTLKESAIWQQLPAGDKIEALLYAVERSEGTLVTKGELLDISDIIAEIFTAWDRAAAR